MMGEAFQRVIALGRFEAWLDWLVGNEGQAWLQHVAPGWILPTGMQPSWGRFAIKAQRYRRTVIGGFACVTANVAKQRGGRGNHLVLLDAHPSPNGTMFFGRTRDILVHASGAPVDTHKGAGASAPGTATAGLAPDALVQRVRLLVEWFKAAGPAGPYD